MKFRSALFIILLCLLTFPSLAQNHCANPILALTPADVQTGTPVVISWSLDGPAQSQTLSGHDFEQPVALGPSQRTYSYVPSKPGEKHVTLTVVTECGTF